MRIIGLLTCFLFSFHLIGQSFKAGYSVEILAHNLNPTSMTIDHHGRIWMTEKHGEVIIIDENGTLNPDPFIRIDVDDFNERGLLGIALHPDFDNQPYVYLYYTVPNENHNRVSRFRSSGDLAVPSSEEIILELDDLSSAIHNGGAMVFDKEGFLFIATGEAGNPSNSQELNNLLGKILRLKDDGSVPSDNPYFEIVEEDNRSIWSIGHRNPFNLYYDSLNDKLYSTDVGAGDYEEINVVIKGRNYGWPLVEGPLIESVNIEEYEDPYYYYDHNEGCAIVGLTGTNFENNHPDSDLQNSLIFADYCNGYIKYFNKLESGVVFELGNNIERPLNLINNHSGDALFLQTRSGIGGGSEQDNTITSDGKLWKIKYTGSGEPSIIQTPENKILPTSEKAQFQIHAIGEDPLWYDWYLNAIEIKSSDENILDVEYNPNLIGLNLLYCIVSNQFGSDTSEVFKLEFTSNNRPEANIQITSGHEFYKAGDTIHFSGQIIDPEDGFIEKSIYSWKIDFHHDLHSHPFIEKIKGVSDTFFIVPTSGEPDTNVWIRIYLSGYDSGNLQINNYLDIFPELNKIHIKGNIDGKINIDGAIRNLPYDMFSVVNLDRTIEVPIIQKTKNHLLIFSHWEDGYLENSRLFAVKENSADTLGIVFDTIPLGSGIGLYAEYYNGRNHNYEIPPDLVRIDTVIGFKWGDSSPDPSIIDNDNFSVRWRGWFQPLFSEVYTFYFSSDDGARIWIEDELILDDWNDHPPQETKFEMFLDASRKYKLEIEYYEKGGGAEVELKWASDHTPKEYIPKRQLIPMEFGHFHARLWNDMNENGQIEPDEPYIPDSDIILLDSFNNYISNTTTNADGFFSFRDFESGGYKIIVIPPVEYINFNFGFGLNELGYSEVFNITPNSLIEERYAIIDKNLTSTSDIAEMICNIYPNPVSKELRMHFNDFEERDICIYDTFGNKVYHLKNNSRDLSINLEKLIGGTYFVYIKGRTGIKIEKLLKI